MGLEEVGENIQKVFKQMEISLENLSNQAGQGNSSYESMKLQNSTVGFRDPRVTRCGRNQGASGGEGGGEEGDVSRIQIVKKRSLDFSLKELGA